MEAYRRHIVVDNINKNIFIQVMQNLHGYPKRLELHNLTNGIWHEYVPKEYVHQFKEAIAAGYQIVPTLEMGGHNEEFYLIQFTELKATTGIINLKKGSL